MKNDEDLKELCNILYEFKKERDTKEQEFIEKMLRKLVESDLEDTVQIK